MLTIHSLEIGPGQAMPKVPDHRVDKKELPMFVPVVTPWVGRSFADNLEFFRSRMNPPDRTLQLSALLLGRPRWTHRRKGLDSMSSAENPIWIIPLDPAETLYSYLIYTSQRIC